jgi:hypothetical protein
MTKQKNIKHTDATDSASSDLPSYPSIANCASRTGIPETVLKKAKAAGCPAFDAGSRVHLAKFLPWIFAREDADGKDWGDTLKKFQALRQEVKLKQEEGELIDRAWMAGRIHAAAGKVDALRIKSEAEHPLLFAAAAGDVPACRAVIQQIWDEIISSISALESEFKE